MKELIFSICFTDTEMPEVRRRNLFADLVGKIEEAGHELQLFNLDDSPPFWEEPPVVNPPYLVIEGLTKGGTFRVFKGDFDELIDEVDRTLSS